MNDYVSKPLPLGSGKMSSCQHACYVTLHLVPSGSATADREASATLATSEKGRLERSRSAGASTVAMRAHNAQNAASSAPISTNSERLGNGPQRCAAIPCGWRAKRDHGSRRTTASRGSSVTPYSNHRVACAPSVVGNWTRPTADGSGRTRRSWTTAQRPVESVACCAESATLASEIFSMTSRSSAERSSTFASHQLREQER